MAFAGVNYLAVVVAALAGFGVGALWYKLFDTQWLAAVGKKHADLGPRAIPFAIAFLANLLIAFMLAGVIGHMGGGGVRAGIISGAAVWLGFVITTMAVNHAFQAAPRALTVIDGGHWLAVLLVMGAVIGAFGVPSG